MKKQQPVLKGKIRDGKKASTFGCCSNTRSIDKKK